MIKAEFFIDKQDKEIYGFCIKGHSGYAKYGSDIVCASVSSAALMTANTITEVIGAIADVKCDDDGYLSLAVDKSDVLKCREILCGLRLHLCSIEEQYQKFLTVKYLEV